MIHITDEMLMAYVDGEVSAAEAAVVEEAIERDAELKARVAKLAALQTRIRDAFDAGEIGEPPPALRALVATRAPSPLRFSKAWKSRGPWLAASALAACLATVVSLSVLRHEPARWIEPVSDGVALSGGVERIATTALSGTDHRIDDMVVSPILSFVARDGRICRELALASAELNARLIVCRAANDDDWCFEAFSRTHPPAGGDRPYSAAGREPDATIEAAYKRLEVARELSVGDESVAIASKWTKTTGR